ncbi:MAG: phytoene synthase, partial [Rhodobacteraceae bacterium]
DRFAAAMAAPVAARRVLLPLYAFNVEVSRAPWVTSEPMIGEMRLQWWRDALEEIGAARPVRRHEVTVPLAEVLHAPLASQLDELIAARRWDLYTDAFEDTAHFQDYLKKTGGRLMWISAHLLGAHVTAASAIVALGSATALVRFLAAVPDLEARGRIPLIDGRKGAVAELAKTALAAYPGRLRDHAGIPRKARAALIEAWQTRPLLEQIARAPERVAEGRVGLSEFEKRVRLFLATF